MGRVILCTGRRAESPYFVRGAGIRVATIEELCYVIRHNLDMLDLSVIERDMAVFIKDELGLESPGAELEQLIMSGASLRDRIVVIFKSCDIYTEEEITKVCSEIDEIAVMSNAERRKRRADRHMKEGSLAEAAGEYRGILALEEAKDLSDTCRGDILHNLAVAEINHGEIEDAIRLFSEAYETNKREQSLKSYLIALKLSKNTTKYRAEVQRLVYDVQLFNEIENEVNAAEEDFEQSSEFTEINRLKVLWQQGRKSEAKRLSDEMILGMKQMYRQGLNKSE